MDVYEAAIKKRDRRRFLDRPVPEESLRRILQAARMTGSSSNREPNRYVVVRDRETLAAMAATFPMGKWLAYVPLAVVICQEGNEHEFDAGRAAQSMMLTAWAEGIGSCPAHPPAAKLRPILGIPEAVFVNRVIGFGYIDPAHDAPPSGVARVRKPLAEIVHEGRW